MASKSGLLMLAVALSAAASPLNVTELNPRQDTQRLFGIFAQNHFATALAPGGTQASFQAGFTLNDDQGNTIWSSSAPAGQSPCTIYGASFSLSGGCLPETYIFDCMVDFAKYGNCAVWTGNTDGDPTDCQEADGDTYEDVLFAGMEDVCVIAFDIGGSCGADEDLTASNVDDKKINDLCPFR